MLARGCVFEWHQCLRNDLAVDLPKKHFGIVFSFAGCLKKRFIILAQSVVWIPDKRSDNRQEVAAQETCIRVAVPTFLTSSPKRLRNVDTKFP